MSATLLGAIHEVWGDDGGLQTAAVSLFNEEPREGTPLGTFVVLASLEQPEKPDDFEGGRQVDATWTFRWWFEGTASAETLGGLIRRAFDLKPLDIDNAQLLRMRVDDYRVSLDRLRSTGTRRVTRTELVFHARLHRRGA
jgi:hypothetical protein